MKTTGVNITRFPWPLDEKNNKVLFRRTMENAYAARRCKNQTSVIFQNHPVSPICHTV